MKRTLHTCIAVTLAGASSGAFAADWDFSGGATMTTNYLFRGITQTSNNPAVQGEFDINHSSGLYAGVWASNVNFEDGDQANIEMDWYGGFARDAGKWNWDIGGIYYTYPGAASGLDYDYWEIKGGLGYKLSDAMSLGAEAYYSPEFFGKTGDAWYFPVSLDWTLPADFAAKFLVAYQSIDDTDPDSYWHYSAGVSKDLAGFTLDLTWSGINDDGKDLGGDNTFVFSVSRGF